MSQHTLKLQELELILGQTVSGGIVRARHLANPHVYISGSTGSGKSVFLRYLLGQVMRQEVCCLVLDYSDDFSGYLDFICVDGMGNLLQPDFVSQKFQKLLRQYNLRPIRFHDLRHSCATIMLYLGYSLKDIQTWLGHSNYNFTADTYLHTAPTAHLQMANTYSEKLEELLPPQAISQDSVLEKC